MGNYRVVFGQVIQGLFETVAKKSIPTGHHKIVFRMVNSTQGGGDCSISAH